MQCFLAKIAVGCVILLALAGCAPVGYVRPNTDTPRYTQDTAQCEYEIQMAQRGIYPLWYGNASQQLGYYLGAAIGQAIRQQQLRTLCMQAKGYTPVRLAETTLPSTDQVYISDTPQPAYSANPAVPYTGQAPASNVQQPTYSVNDTGQPGRGDMGGVPPRSGAAPAVAGIKGDSKYLLQVENMVKAGGCSPPSTAMTAKGAGTESFTVGCPNGTTLAVKCDVETCRVLQ